MVGHLLQYTYNLKGIIPRKAGKIYGFQQIPTKADLNFVGICGLIFSWIFHNMCASERVEKRFRPHFPRHRTPGAVRNGSGGAGSVPRMPENAGWAVSPPLRRASCLPGKWRASGTVRLRKRDRGGPAPFRKRAAGLPAAGMCRPRRSGSRDGTKEKSKRKVRGAFKEERRNA